MNNFIDRKMQVMETLMWLIKQFPSAFNMKMPKPLKVSIHQDIFNLLPTLGDAPSKTKIREAIFFYTKMPDYLNAATKYQSRVDLNGKITGEVTKDQKDFSFHRLRIRKKFAEKKATIKPDGKKKKSEQL